MTSQNHKKRSLKPVTGAPPTVVFNPDRHAIQEVCDAPLIGAWGSNTNVGLATPGDV